ncbi:glycosyltransferase family 2 protein [Elizabethkingia anophelis]|uniref:glycosyltransferase family 2 protein n=1 Tax=Elizabethkingia anophelis TaxID=1117645 RepID=UPI000664EAF3|nr:glycosyltransferase family 2 protein [Elizabethkingia anophelis]AQW92599.1 glycosyl transferase family A [Elizabethkingia anophelis]KUY14319.1 glycosyl transferase family A [Elizabethkingia anophelis]MCT3726531.1 glycosyltransferase family 2 protein [Elizabethkingia anophelis]MCT4237398.1 glycosyltransferase family 2 protein [Elizabethkingia anophelis]MCT4318661.1 glycosyltransferase family 2 protein [Elizabethkingia anophelis]
MKKLYNTLEQPLVSVIIPVYNAENTLHIAMDSLLGQSYQPIELVVVNDCSKDGTHSVLQKYEAKLAQYEGFFIKIINHEANQGVAAARNTGLNNVTGDYIYYVDADDYIEKNAIELMVDKILKTEADIVGCNWYLSFNQNERKMNQSLFVSPIEAIQKMLNGTMRWNLWLFMVRRSLYEEYNIRFLDGMNMGEDMMVMIKLFTHAEKVSYIDYALYHYGQSNEDSLTKTYSKKHRKEVTTNLFAVEEYLRESKYSGEIGEGINFLKLNIKLPLLISDKKDNYKKWIEWFPEANSLVMENKNLPFRTRFLQWMAVKKQYWFLWLYYNIVFRYIYGVIYK